MKIITTEFGAAPKAPYSQGIVSNGFLFTAGQVAILPGSGESAGDTIEIQAHQVCKNLKAILEAAGTGIEKVVKTNSAGRYTFLMNRKNTFSVSP